jgi:hypothetical protein
MPLHRSLFALIAPLAIVLSEARAGELLVVDARGTTPYVDIQSAVDAASADDVVLVLDHPGHAGSYAGFQITGRGCTIVARQGGGWWIDGVTVRNVPAGQHVSLVGLRVRGGPALRVQNCAGTVTVADTIAEGQSDIAVVDVVLCADVRLVRCDVLGGGTSQFGVPGSLDVSDSHVWVDGGELRGTDGNNAPGSFTTCHQGGTGGPGLRVRGTFARVEVRGTHVTGGLPGWGSWPHCDGPPGPAALVEAPGTLFLRDVTLATLSLTPLVGPVVTIPGRARRLESDWFQREDGQLSARAEGEPGDAAWLLHAPTPGVRDLGVQAGALLVDSVTLGARVGLGICDASGVASGELMLPVPSGDDVSLWWVQVATSGSSGVTLGEARVVVQVGPDAPIAPPGAALRVDATSPVSGSGRSWSSPLTDVAHALLCTFGSRDEPADVWLRAGVHVIGGDGVVLDRPIILAPVTVLRGGFRGDEMTLEERAPTGFDAVLTGDALGDDGPGFTNRTDNSIELFRPPAYVLRQPRYLVRFERLTLSGAEGTGTVWGPIRLEGDVSLEHVIVTDNRSPASDLIEVRGSATLDRCRFHGNHAEFMTRVTGVTLAGDTARVTSSAWTGNRGAALGVSRVDGVLANLTVASNTMPPNWPAVYLTANGAPIVLSNSVLWNNSAGGQRGESAQIRVSLPNGGWSTTLASTCIGGLTGGLTGVALHGLDPRFVDPLGPDQLSGTADDDYRLRTGSPCVDAGNNGLTPAQALLDLDGRPRVVDDPLTPDTGVGGPPVIDMGAYER